MVIQESNKLTFIRNLNRMENELRTNRVVVLYPIMETVYLSFLIRKGTLIMETPNRRIECLFMVFVMIIIPIYYRSAYAICKDAEIIKNAKAIYQQALKFGIVIAYPTCIQIDLKGLISIQGGVAP